MGAGAAWATPYAIDDAKKTITVWPEGDVNGNLNSLLSRLVKRGDQSVKWTLRLMPGEYVLTKSLIANNLKNVDIVSDLSNPATLKKRSDWDTVANEYLMYLKYAQDVKVQGLRFVGLHVYDPKDNTKHWQDQGLFLASTRRVTIINDGFIDFGNAAIRTNTDAKDPSTTPVNSFDNVVAFNLFRNIWQTTTTTDSTSTGRGTQNYRFEGNVFYDLRGSVKFALRSPGGKTVRVVGNTIKNSTGDGFEIVGYDDLELWNNTVSNVANFAMNIYTNDGDRTSLQWDWGNDINIHDNSFNNIGRGLRFANKPYANGEQFVADNVTFRKNTLRTIADRANPAINVLNGNVHGLSLIDNKVYDFVGSKVVGLGANVTIKAMSGNTIDDKPVE